MAYFVLNVKAIHKKIVSDNKIYITICHTMYISRHWSDLVLCSLGGRRSGTAQYPIPEADDPFTV